MGGENLKSTHFCSPNGELLACVNLKNLTIKNINNGHVVATFDCDRNVEHVTWSADSKLILCAMYKEAMVNIFWVLEPHRALKISEGPAGLAAACFSPDHKYVLTSLYYVLSTCLYALDNKTSYMLPGSKLMSDGLPGITFSLNGEFLAVAERQKDQIGIYSCSSWNMLMNLQCSDTGGMSWSPDSLSLAVWGRRCQYSLQVFLINGHCIYSESSKTAGIRNVVWSSCGNILVISRWNSKDLKLMNCLTWKMIAYLEPSRALLEAGLTDKVCEAYSPDVPMDADVPPPTVVGRICNYDKFPGPDKKLIKFSLCRKYLSVADGSAVWLWDCGRLVLLIELSHCVSNTAWDELGRLVIWSRGKELIWWDSRDCRLFKQLLPFLV